MEENNKKQSSGKLIDCPKCNGSGNINGDVCTKCNGTGKINLLLEQIDVNYWLFYKLTEILIYKILKNNLMKTKFILFLTTSILILAACTSNDPVLSWKFTKNQDVKYGNISIGFTYVHLSDSIVYADMTEMNAVNYCNKNTETLNYDSNDGKKGILYKTCTKELGKKP